MSRHGGEELQGTSGNSEGLCVMGYNFGCKIMIEGKVGGGQVREGFLRCVSLDSFCCKII